MTSMKSLKHLIAIGLTAVAAGCNSDRENRTTSSSDDYRSRETATYSGTTGAASTDSAYGGSNNARSPSRSNPGSDTSGTSGTSGTGATAMTSLSDPDRTFVTDAVSGGMFEVQSSQTAVQKNLSPDLMQVAQMMITDHTKANQELKDIVSRKNITISQKLQPKHQTLLDRLQNASGDQFASQYRTIQIQAHQETISLFQREARDGQDADLKSFAQRALPTLQKHLDHLQRSSSGSVSDMKNPGSANPMPDMPDSKQPNDDDNPKP